MIRARATLTALALSTSALAAQGPVLGPAMVESPRVRALFLSPAMDAAIDHRQSLLELVASCRRVMRVDSAAAAQLLSATGWERPLEARPNTLVIVVVPIASQARECPRVPAQLSVAESRGLGIARDTGYVRNADLERAELRVGDRILSAISTELGRIQLLTPRGLQPTRSGALRLTFELDSLAPDATGRRNDVELHVWSRADEQAHRIPIPWSALESVWRSALAERSARASSASSDNVDVSALEAPMDADLQAARRAYLDGDAATANRFILSRLGEGEMEWTDERTARLQLGLTFASMGDSTATRIVFAELIRAEPCLSLSETAPVSARRIVAPLARPPSRCTSNSLAMTALRASLLPGFGRPVSGARAVATRLLVGGVISAAFVTGMSQRDASRSSYAAYQGATRSADAERLFARAESERTGARLRFALAAIVYGTSLTEAVVREYLHAQRLARVRELAPRLGANR